MRFPAVNERSASTALVAGNFEQEPDQGDHNDYKCDQTDKTFGTHGVFLSSSED